MIDLKFYDKDRNGFLFLVKIVVIVVKSSSGMNFVEKKLLFYK